MTKTDVGFKEWAAVCEALADGSQTLILRKGGIVEDGGEFRPDHPLFLMVPTYWHQLESGIKSTKLEYLKRANDHKPSDDKFVIRHAAKVYRSLQVDSLESLRRLDPFHIWSTEIIDERFHRWEKDIVHAMIVRVYELSRPLTLDILPEHRGCKSWIKLDSPFVLDDARPILSEAEFNDCAESIIRAAKA